MSFLINNDYIVNPYYQTINEENGNQGIEASF